MSSIQPKAVCLLGVYSANSKDVNMTYPEQQRAEKVIGYEKRPKKYIYILHFKPNLINNGRLFSQKHRVPFMISSIQSWDIISKYVRTHFLSFLLISNNVAQQ